MRRAVWALLIAVTAVGIVFLFVLPGQTWLQQSRAFRNTSASLHALNNENAKLGQRIKALKNDQVIENMAREQYGLVKPGQKAYVIVPSPSGSGSGGSASAGSGSGASAASSGSSASSGSASKAGSANSGASSKVASSRPATKAPSARARSSHRSFWQRLEFWN